MSYTFGVKSLDEVLGSSIANGGLVVIAGHPGSGKTTLASTICYGNALRGRKCLYISFQEEKDKLFSIMKKLDIHLDDIESKGMLKYVKFPIILAAEDVVDEISKLVNSLNPDIVIVDSISPLLKVVEKDVSRRAYITNYFYALAAKEKKLIVLIAEIPLGGDIIGLGDIEFVADVVLILRHSIVRNLLIRELEIRKARGSPIPVARATLTISEGRGIDVYFPIILSNIPSKPMETFRQPCTSLEKKIGELYRGDIVYISFPSDARPYQALEYILAILLTNNLRTLIISYTISPSDIKKLIMDMFKEIAMDLKMYDNVMDKLIDNVMGKIIDIVSINPTAMDISQIVVHTLNISRERKPDIVVIYGIDILALLTEEKQLVDQLFNMLNYMRMEGFIVIFMGCPETEAIHNIFSMFADIIIKFNPSREYRGRVLWEAYVWRRGRDPYVIGSEEFHECIDELHRSAIARIQPLTGK